MPARDFLLALVVVVLWGLNIVAAKVGVAELPPFLFTALRFALVAALVVPFVRLPRAAVADIARLSITFGTLGFGLLFASVERLDASTASIVNQLGVPFAVIVGILVLRERPGPTRLLGIGVAFAGVVVVAGGPGDADLVGVLLMVGSQASAAYGTLFLKRLTALPPLGVVGWMCLFAAPQLLVLSLVFESGQAEAVAAASPTAWAMVAYSALGASMTAHGLYAALVRRHELSRVVPVTLLTPVVGIGAAVVLLGEALTMQKLLGALVVMAGVALIQVRRATAPPAPVPAETAGRP